jgi:hypothetical protein
VKINIYCKIMFPNKCMYLVCNNFEVRNFFNAIINRVVKESMAKHVAALRISCYIVP